MLDERWCQFLVQWNMKELNTLKGKTADLTSQYGILQ